MKNFLMMFYYCMFLVGTAVVIKDLGVVPNFFFVVIIAVVCLAVAKWATIATIEGVLEDE